MFLLQVDFNEIDNDRVVGLQRYAEGPRPLEQGDRVLAHDEGEHEALGIVETVVGDRVRLRLEWSTFGPAGRFRYVGSRAWLAGNVLVGAEQPGQPHARIVQASPSLVDVESDANSVKLPA